MKKCKICDKEIPLDRRRVTCSIDCRKELQKRDSYTWRKNNPEKYKAIESRHANSEKRKFYSKEYKKQHGYRMALKYKYGITFDDYERMSQTQKGCCAICENKEKLLVDHCHKTGKVRKLLCYSCNTGIGLLKDNPRLLEKAFHYLKGGYACQPLR